MMRLVLFGVVAFVLGAAGGTGFAVLRAPAKPAAHPAASDSTLAPAGRVAANADGETNGAPTDSSDAAGAPVRPGESVAAAAPANSGTASPPTSAAPGGVRPATAEAPVGAGGDRVAVGTLMSPDGAALADSCRVVAKILAAMKPADAAKILSHLSDDQVEGILRASGVRQAGVLLARLDPERGATLSRRLIIRPEGGGR
jgi:hypothetical protein